MKQLTVADLIAKLNEFPSDTPLNILHSGDIFTDILCVQEAWDVLEDTLLNVTLITYHPDEALNSDITEFLGRMLPKI